MATKGNGKKRILEDQITFEFFGELEVEAKPKKKEKVKLEIKREKKSKAIKLNHIKRNRKIKDFKGEKWTTASKK